MPKAIYGLLGYPLKHSYSRIHFTDKFEKQNIDAEYLNFELPSLDQFNEILEAYPNLHGMNVTIPYKEKVMTLLDGLDEKAKNIGAVNVIKFIRNSDTDKPKLIGYNSDYIGFRNSIAPLIKVGEHKYALILGTGGASKAVLQGLKDLGVECRFVSRSKSENNFTYSELDEATLAHYTVIVNTSPVGTFPNEDEAPAIPYHLLTDKHLLYDLVYNPSETKFLRHGGEQGATIKNGSEMLGIQAEAAWEIWNS